jgi:hypothetical protein
MVSFPASKRQPRSASHLRKVLLSTVASLAAPITTTRHVIPKRAILKWTRRELADAARVTLWVVAAFEDGREVLPVYETEICASLEAVGLLHPVVVDRTGALIAGERRLRACADILGWTNIRVRRIDLAVRVLSKLAAADLSKIDPAHLGSP